MKGYLIFSLLLTSMPLFSEELALFDDPIPLDCEEQACDPPSELEERNLFAQINCESHRLYNSLDCRGKVRAIELAELYGDKNVAVQIAAEEMSRRQILDYHEKKTFSQQLEKKAGQVPYQRRFGN